MADLRARIKAALEPHIHNGCLVDAELGDALDAVMAVVEDALRHLVSDCCHQAYDGPHAMACRRYAGPIDHWRVYSVPDVADLTVRGLAECTCGVRYSADVGGCPNVAETWRGASPEQQDVP